MVMIIRGGAEAADTGKGMLAKKAAWEASCKTEYLSISSLILPGLEDTGIKDGVWFLIPLKPDVQEILNG